jgi:hypothetical protein
MKRYVLELDDNAARLIDQLSVAEGTSKSDVILRSVATYAALAREVTGQPSKQIAVTRHDAATGETEILKSVNIHSSRSS